MKTMKNFLIIPVLMLGTLLTFTQCEKNQEFQSMNTHALNDVNGFGSNSGTHWVSTANNPDGICECLTANFNKEDLNSAERDAILFMREEEKLARDVYIFLYYKWEFPVFNNIARSEERHMAAMLCLIDRYDLADPVGNNENGVFVNQQLAALYQSLIASGANSLVEAIKVGAIIEDLDIADLVALMQNTEIENADVQAAFASLTKGSRNHLRAFVKTLARYGQSYDPQYMSTEYYDETINSQHERGGGIFEGLIECSGRGTENSGECLGDGTGICSADCTGVGEMNGSGGAGGGQGPGKKQGKKVDPK